MKESRPREPARAPARTEGTKGAALRPPAYGIEFADRPALVDPEQEAELAADAVMGASSASMPPPDAGTPSVLAALRTPRLATPGLAAKLAKPSAGPLGKGTLPASVAQTLAAPGRPLDAATRTFMEPRFGHDFADVRVHTDAVAAHSAAELRALAYTAGRSIAFAEGRYEPASPAGKRLLAHELAHVVQQRGIASATPPIQRFEAPLHESNERVGLVDEPDASLQDRALSNEEASASDFGNWMRDVNQVFVPLVQGLLPDDLVFSMISYIAATKFGRRLTPEQFGYYIPAEHLDSPAGLVAADDLRPGQPDIPIANTASHAPARPEQFITPQDPVGPESTVLGASIFDVDQAGVIAYLRRSNLHVERRLELAVQSGRNPEGFMHLGAALHSIEDLFAHSNWIEIAVNRVLETHPELLPQLHGPDRHAFTLGPSVTLPGKQKRPRPVLLTGSFTSTDTQVSITSEVVNFLDKPLPPPKSNAEAKLKEEFVGKMLRTFENQLDGNPKFHGAIRNVVRDSLPSYVPARERVANGIVALPLSQLYDIGHLLPSILPDKVKDATTRKVKRLIDDAVSEQCMQPLGRRLQAEALGTRIADTSLLQVLVDSQRQARGEISPSELAIMQKTEDLGLGTVADQKAKAQGAGARRAKALQATPLPIVAGPSHSQIAKDHVNAPFFGIAFAVASVAVRALRRMVVAAWSEHDAGKTPFDFGWSSFPTQADDKELFHTSRASRATEEHESLERGRKIIRQGNEAAQPYDLDAMRHDSAKQMRAAAAALRVIAVAPDKSAGALSKLSGLLGGLKHEQVEYAQAQLQRAAAAARAGGTKLRTNVSLEQIATDIETHATAIEQARTHAEREATNAKLVELRNQGLAALADRPSVDLGLAAAITIMLDQQIANTSVAFTGRQRRVVEGREDAPEQLGPRKLQVRTLKLPSRKDRSPAVQAVLAKSRELFNHPYESKWWVPTVVAHIQAHPKQIATDITARNAGVPFYTRPGDVSSGHEH
jgi:hypothetical protein